MFAARLSRAVFSGLLAAAVVGCGGGSGEDAGGDGQSPHSPARSNGVVVFFGDSLTEGYKTPREQAYPALISEDMAAAGYANPVINAGVSGDTSADGVKRISSVLGSPVALFFLALGINDGRLGLSPDEMHSNLKSIIDAVRSSNPDAVIVVAGNVTFIDHGTEYEAAFKKVFPEVAAETGATLMPFLLEGVFGDEQYYNLPDNLHPNAKGHKVIAANVWKVIEPLLKQIDSTNGS